VDESSPDRQLNIHIDPENMAGVYANFANISFSPFEFTLTFARVDHEVEEGDVPGVVVARVNVSHKFMRDLLDAMEDTYSKWTTTEGIRNLPEAPPRSEDSED
jgi:hemerythrin-like domain-containing protein